MYKIRKYIDTIINWLFFPARFILKRLIREIEINKFNILQNELSAMRAEFKTSLDQIGMYSVTSSMQTRLLIYSEIYGQKKVSPPPRVGLENTSFGVYLDRFKSLHPHLYDTWASVNFGKNLDEFRYRPEFSCAVDQRPDARLFAGFIAPYLQERILDIGCGPYSTPLYLRGYPVENISGLDPLEPFELHPFEFVQGFAEFLPWQDETFDVAIAATSLDHTLDLNLALSEIRRVLKPGGIFLVWEWFADHVEPYKPEDQSPGLIDRYHLFNFDRKWFEEVVCKDFAIVEKVQLFGEYYHYHFYALKLSEK